MLATMAFSFHYKLNWWRLYTTEQLSEQSMDQPNQSIANSAPNLVGSYTNGCKRAGMVPSHGNVQYATIGEHVLDSVECQKRSGLRDSRAKHPGSSR